LTDFAAAADLPYDTYIPEGELLYAKYFIPKIQAIFITSVDNDLFQKT
jgi:hypothetical protein